MKYLGVDAFQYGIISFGIVLKNGNADYKFALGEIDPLAPWYPDTSTSLLNFAIVNVKLQRGTVTLLINGKQEEIVLQKACGTAVKSCLIGWLRSSARQTALCWAIAHSAALPWVLCVRNRAGMTSSGFVLIIPA
jgi:hypothetical protein